MNRFLLKATTVCALCIAVAGGDTVSANAVNRTPFAGDAVPFRYAKKAKATGRIPMTFGKTLPGTRQNAADRDADHQIPGGDNVYFLDAPDGSTWFATGENKTKTVVLDPNTSITEQQIIGYTYTIYDSNFQEIGTITDNIDFLEDETRCANVQLDVTVTQKFFNYNENYEVMVSVFMNHADYSMSYRTYAYSIGGEKDDEGNDVALQTIDGYVVDAINMGDYSEKFYISFLTQEAPESPEDYPNYIDYLAEHYSVVTTYKPASYSAPASVIDQWKLQQLRAPGDTMDAPFFMLSSHNGKLTIICSEYEKSFYVDPTGFSQDESATPDNHLIVTVREMVSAYTATLTETAKLTIPCEQPTAEDTLYSFYGIGLLSFTDDVDYTHFGATDNKPVFYITRQDYTTASDERYITSFYVYNSDGQLVKTLAENTFGYMMLSDLAGRERQCMFIYNENETYSFKFVDIYSGTEVLDMPSIIDGNNITVSQFDRAAYGDSYCYVSQLAYDDTDEAGNNICRLAWINTEGKIDHIDRINIGKDVAMAQVNITKNVLTPYLFDTDTEMEYMVLVKRYTGNSTETQEEFLISGTENGVCFTAKPDETNGNIKSLAIISQKSYQQLCIIYRDKEYKFHQYYYDLPMTKFVGGDGTAENPYMIATVADLQQIASNPAAFYKVANDIDASGYTFKPIENFSGTLDGNGKIIRNLTVGHSDSYYTGIFNNCTQGATIKNMTLYDPTIELTTSSDAAGLLAGSVQTATIDNIQVYGLKATGNGYYSSFGSIVGQATNTTAISNCSVIKADIDLPEAMPAGGIVGTIRTGTSVKACSFTGAINGATSIGGIVGESSTGDETIENCHVDADLTAQNTVGGIIGYSARSIISHCYVEGSIKATTPTQWGSTIAAGGIAGSLDTYYATESTAETEPATSAPVISHCVVNLESLTAPAIEGEPEYAGQFDTVHRIVGKSSINDEPEIVDWDPSTYEPIFGDPAGPELALADNYAYSSLAIIDPKVESNASSTEGQSIDAADVNTEFFTGLGFAFGTDATAPWISHSDNDIALYFESYILIERPEIAVLEGETFTVDVRVLNRAELTEDELDYVCDYDEAAVEPTGVKTFDGEILSIEFKCLTASTSTITVTMLGSSAQAIVTGTSGIDQIVTGAESGITFDGSSVTAPGRTIAVYSVAGNLVATGTGTVSIATLPAGVYIAVATDSEGSRAVLKLAK